ncbi:hypothetical protein LZC95_19610 [Pendulispora brunnea]|uniref:Histone H1 n=1 Tax=Pendulispora brunnea TaxID=2905690 RepID=A0ABZ2KK22_9BACT
MMADVETQKTPEEKIAFIQSLPLELGASEVIQKGKDEGYAFSKSYVYGARAKARKSAAHVNAAPKKEKSPAAQAKTTKAAPRKRRLKRGDKAAFVRTMPNASPPDVVKAALDQGIPLTLQTVYATRGGDAKKKKGARTAPKAKKSNGASKALATVPAKAIAQLDKAAEFVLAKGQPAAGLSPSHLGAAVVAFVEAALALPPTTDGVKTARAGLLEAVLDIGLLRPDQIVSAMRANIGTPRGAQHD